MMLRRARRGSTVSALLLFPLLVILVILFSPLEIPKSPAAAFGVFQKQFRWRDVPLKHPVRSITELPSGSAAQIPRIQFSFPSDSPQRKALNKERRRQVKEAFTHSWNGYKKGAWLQDEVLPVSGKSKNGFGGWAATLVDSLDTLWIMDLKKEFKSAVKDLHRLDFSSYDGHEVNIFETTIRHLGGLLSAYDISGHKHSSLINKAIELGDMLYAAFDTPNRMPVTRWDWKNAAEGGDQLATRSALIAELGSLSLEFTHLSQLTGDPKYYDAIARITNMLEANQNGTNMPGIWPVFINAHDEQFTDMTFTLGGMADSAYEYLPKQHIMLGGRTDQYRTMYNTALTTAKEEIFYRAMNPENRKLKLAGSVRRYSKFNGDFKADGQHLSCFLGGVVALGAKIFEQSEELDTAKQLVDGCIWAYESMPSGIMPESFTAVRCESEDCDWSSEKWYAAVAGHNTGGTIDERYVETAQALIKERRLAPGFANIEDARFLLRPEAIESVFVLYRITGDAYLQDKAWNMFQSINNLTRTSIAYASLSDVRDTEPELIDSMESFWTAETLKYFYLIFSSPDLVSLDDYVL